LCTSNIVQEFDEAHDWKVPAFFDSSTQYLFETVFRRGRFSRREGAKSAKVFKSQIPATEHTEIIEKKLL